MAAVFAGHGGPRRSDLTPVDSVAIIIDLGTTTIVSALVEPATGEIVARSVIINPQRELGLDVISRLAVAATAAGEKQLQILVNKGLEQQVVELLAFVAAGTTVTHIIIAGNTVMQHLLLGLPVTTLLRPPYRPQKHDRHGLTTSQIGWQRAMALNVLPEPGGFVGGDLVAFLYGQDLAGPLSAASRPRLYLDLGTNAEIALLAGDRLLATSAAAGPAFEAGNLSCGMLAQPGAITRMTIVGERLQLEVVGGVPPLGLCGSGAISAIATLRQAGIISRSGQLLPALEVSSNLANYLQGAGKDAAFILYRDARRTIVLTQEDIRQVQLATAAVRAGIEVLLAKAGIAADELADVVITGSFGTALVPNDLEVIGLLPPGGAAQSHFVANGVLSGLARAVASPAGLAELAELASSLQVMPLSGTPLFESLFIDHLNFPE